MADEVDIEGFQNELKGILDDSIENVESAMGDDVGKPKREEVLSIIDPSDIGLVEYEIFMDYGIANLAKMASKAANSSLDHNQRSDIVTAAMSSAIMTFDVDVAREKGSRFVTHFYWKIRAELTTFYRDKIKGEKNILSTGDDSMVAQKTQASMQSDMFGNTQDEDQSNVGTPEWEDTQKVEYDRSKKLEWAMREVRHELPRENNLIIDVAIGEISDFSGRKYSLKEYADMTDQPEGYVRRLYASSLSLIRQKMTRKDYIRILLDDDMTTEDLHKDTDIVESLERFEESERIIASSDVQTIIKEAEESSDAPFDFDIKDIIK